MVSPLLKQSWIVLGVLLKLFTVGLILSYPYSLLPELRLSDSSIKIDLNTGSWLASCPMLATLIGQIAASVLMDWIGRRRTFTVMLLPATCGWILIYFATNVTTLMIARILGGITMGQAQGFGGILIGEYVCPEHRGIFLAFKSTAVSLGVMSVHVMSLFLNWRQIALLGFCISILPLLSSLTWPESPSWLATQRKYKKSEDAFHWLRGTSEKSTKEFNILIRAQKERLAETQTNLKFQERTVMFVKKFKRKDVFKSVLIVCFGRILLEATGRHTFPTFAKDMLSDMNKATSSLNDYITLTIDILSVSSCALSTILVKCFKRRPLLFFSAIPSLILLLCISVYLVLVSEAVISNTRQWIPLVTLVIYFVIVNLGCSTVPYVLLGELFPLHYKGPALLVYELFSSIALLVTFKVIPILIYAIKMQGLFALNAFAMLVPLTYMYFTLPETRNKTLQEIEDFFNNGKFDRNVNIGDDESGAMLREDKTKVHP